MEGLRKQLERRQGALKKSRETWDITVRDICEMMHPYGGVFDEQYKERNMGQRLDDQIIDPKPIEAVNISVAGLISSMTNPAKKWFGITTSDDALSELPEVKRHLEIERTIIQSELRRSNFYEVLADHIYPDLFTISTSAMVLYDKDGMAYFRPVRWGKYWIDIDAHGTVDTFFCELTFTSRELAQMFDEENLSPAVKNDLKHRHLETERRVVWAIVPNEDFDGEKIGSFPFLSVWYDTTDKRKDALLRKSGFYEFPAIVPRWSVTEGDAYGRGPGWEARGVCRSLQHNELTRLTLKDLTKQPPLNAYGEIMGQPSLVPGEVNYVSGEMGMAKLEPLFMPHPQSLQAAQEDRLDYHRQIDRAFKVHLWMDLLNDERKQRATATEVAYRRQEALTQLGPVLFRLNADLLAPTILRVRAMLVRAGMMPKPPEVLRGREIKIEFISVLHQMQQAQTLGSVRTLVGDTIGLAQAWPEALDKINADAVVDQIADVVGAPPELVRSADEVAEIREARQQREAQAEQLAQAQAVTEAARNLGGAGFEAQQIAEIARQYPNAANAQAGTLAPVLQ